MKALLVKWINKLKKLLWFVLERGAFEPAQLWFHTKPAHFFLFVLVISVLFVVLADPLQRGLLAVAVVVLILVLANKPD